MGNLTAPDGQAVELIADSGFTEQAKITETKMQPCYSLMLGWNENQTLPKVLNRQEIAWDETYVYDSIIDRIFIKYQMVAQTVAAIV